MANLDEQKLQTLIGQVVNDFGAIASSALVVMGDKIGLYRAMKAIGPTTPDVLAAATGTSERYVRSWLVNQAASGYIDYDAATEHFTLTPEQAAIFAEEDTPFSMVGGFTVLTAAIKAEPRIAEAMRTGDGMLWSEHDEGLFTGTARFFKPGYLANLTQSWIPAISGLQDRLERGATVADIGCGFGASTIIMAQAFPNSRFLGFDSHADSIRAARKAARDAGLEDRVTFDSVAARKLPGTEYDLVTFFDCLHDIGDPVGAARAVREALKEDGFVMLVEPMAGEKTEENLNPVGRIYSAASVLVCTPHAIAEGGPALGTQATEGALKQVFDKAGFSSFRRVAETPTNRVFEARP